jgi:flavin-dependent dehydrogenase
MDVVIVGAGPAGSNLARLLAKRYSVMVIEARDITHPAPYDPVRKACGGLLAPDAQRMLARLSLGIPKDVLVDPQVFGVNVIDLKQQVTQNYQRFYFNIDREKFDRWLVALIPPSVTILPKTQFVRYEKTDEGIKVFYRQHGVEKSVLTQFLVGADGANSLVRRQLQPRFSPIRYIAIQEWVKTDVPSTTFGAIFDPRLTDFYGWVIPKDQALVIGIALKPGPDAQEKFATFKARLTDHGYRFGQRIRSEGAFIVRPSLKDVFAGRDTILLIGEAAGAISPSSAEGISYALKTSLMLSSALLEHENAVIRHYERSLWTIRFNILLKQLKSPFMYWPMLRQLALKSGIKRL